MLRLVIDDKIPFIREAAARLGECIFLPGAAITANDVREATCSSREPAPK